jgi:hypothetical protein
MYRESKNNHELFVIVDAQERAYSLIYINIYYLYCASHNKNPDYN